MPIYKYLFPLDIYKYVLVGALKDYSVLFSFSVFPGASVLGQCYQLCSIHAASQRLGSVEIGRAHV